MNVRRGVAVAVLVVAVPLLSSCGVNFGAQTDQVYNPAAGVDARDSSVDVLNALIVAGEDDRGTVIASLVNNNQTDDDSLRGIAGSARDSSLEVTPGGETTIPAGGLLNLATQASITASSDRVRPGNFVELTFSFQRGDPVTLDVPVVNAANPIYENVPTPSASSSASPSASSSTSPSP